MNRDLNLVTCGDSFTFGSEIVNPKFLKDPTLPFTSVKYNNLIQNDYDVENDEYRIQRIWPTLLGERLDASNVINLGKPAISNKWIFNTIITWLLDNYILKNKRTDNLLVIVGWSAVVREEYFFGNGKNKTFEKTLNVTGNSNPEIDTIQQFFKSYLLAVDYVKMGVYNYIDYNYQLALFCEKYNIKYYCFNALPAIHDVSDFENDKNSFFKDLVVKDYINSFKNINTLWERNYYKECNLKWGMVSESSMLLKDKLHNSFFNYIFQYPMEEMIYGGHPSPKGHEIWSEFLFNWITKNEINFYIKDSRTNFKTGI